MKLKADYIRKTILGLFLATAIGQGHASASGLAAAKESGLQEINEQGMALDLSLEQAIDDAKNNNVLLKIAREKIDEARARRWQSDSDHSELLKAGFFGIILQHKAFLLLGSSGRLILLTRDYKSRKGSLI